MANYLIFAIVVGYLLGSIPFGLVLTRLAGLGDIRNVGSGNIGATNVMRVGGLKLALATTICDVSKSAVAFILFGPIAGLAAVVGHNYPVWLKFKGGKGIAATFGFLLGLSPVAFAVCGAIWIIVAMGFGYSSLAALVMLAITPAMGFAVSSFVGYACIGLSILGYWRHRENIKRLILGTESKINWRKKK